MGSSTEDAVEVGVTGDAMRMKSYDSGSSVWMAKLRSDMGEGEGEGEGINDWRLRLANEDRLRSDVVGRGRLGTTLSPSLSRVRILLSLRSDKEEAVICACDNSRMLATDLLCTNALALLTPLTLSGT